MTFKKKLFRILIALYPAPYRKHFEESMLQIYDDVQKEASATEWFIIKDAAISIPVQYMNYFEETMKTNFKNIPAAIAGTGLVLPFAVLVMIAAIGKVFREMGFPNSLNDKIGQAIGVNSSHWVIGIAIFFVFPIAAFLINLIAIVWAGMKQKDMIPQRFIAGNIFSILIMAVGIGIALFIPLHDAIPCFVQGFTRIGFNNMGSLIQVCQNA